MKAPAAPRAISNVAPLVPSAVERQARAHGRLRFAFGSRAILFVLAGVVWMIPVFLNARFIWAMLGWDLLVLIVWLVDLWRLPQPSELRVSRRWLAPAALSVESSVEVGLVNESDRTVQVRLLDAIPSQLRPTPPEHSVTVGPKRDAVWQYVVRPMARGNTPVGAVYLRYQSPLGFAERWAVADVAQTIVTYPNLAEARRHSVALIRSRQIAMEKRSLSLIHI